MSRGLPHHPSRHREVDGEAGENRGAQNRDCRPSGSHARPNVGDPPGRKAAFPQLLPRCGIREPTSPAPTFALPPDTTRGDWCGSSRISRMPIRLRYRNCCRTILAMRIASKRWRSISAKIQGFLESSILIQNRRHRFQFRRMLPRFSCIENQFNRAATDKGQCAKGDQQ